MGLAGGAVVATIIVVAVVVSGSSDDSPVRQAPTPTVFRPLDRTGDYDRAYGGDRTGSPAQQVLSVTEEQWGLMVDVSPADPELAEWACENVKSLLGHSGRVEVWSGSTSLRSC